jgi:putative DNA primase/helicase
VTVNPKHRPAFDFWPRFKVWIETNYLPIIRGQDEGIWRRLVVIPFNHRPSTVDLTLKAALRDEAAGILRWAIEGAKMWRAEGLGTCSAVQWATAACRAQMEGAPSAFDRFLADRCELGPGLGPTPFADLYGALEEWCMQNEEPRASKKAFAAMLDSRKIFGSSRHGDGRARDGIALRCK